MTVHKFIKPAETRGVLTTASLWGLREIRSPGVGGVVWVREPLDTSQAWIDGVGPARLPSTRVTLRPPAIRNAVAAACDAARTPDGPERRRLIDDIAALAEMFSDIMDARYLRLRLEVVDGDACRRFHIDRITARLICTYRGTGTQYGVATEGGADPQAIRTVPTGSPFVMRGTLWPASPDPGLLHRSPPIAGTGETRLVLVLDPADDPDDAPERRRVH